MNLFKSDHFFNRLGVTVFLIIAFIAITDDLADQYGGTEEKMVASWKWIEKDFEDPFDGIKRVELLRNDEGLYFVVGKSAAQKNLYMYFGEEGSIESFCGRDEEFDLKYRFDEFQPSKISASMDSDQDVWINDDGAAQFYEQMKMYNSLVVRFEDGCGEEHTYLFDISNGPSRF